MNGKICIASLRSNPAHMQHLIAYARLCRLLKREPVFLLDPGYRRFHELQQAAEVIYHPESDLPRFAHALFYNASTANVEVASRFKKNGTKTLYVLHEPRQPAMSFVLSEGVAAGMRGLLAHSLSVPMIRMADLVVLASRFGLATYLQSDKKYNERCAYFPLIYDDDAHGDIDGLLQGKRYFAYLGNLCRAHGFDQFVSFMRAQLQRGSEVNFLIASRYPLPFQIEKDPILKANLEKLKIQCGRPLSNEEMNLAYAQSFCIWNVYRRSTQSGVLPKAFMFGTPVLASSNGSFPEFVQDAVNGKFVHGDDHRAIANSLMEIRSDLRSFAVNCRRTFHQEFFYKSNLSRFDSLLNQA